MGVAKCGMEKRFAALLYEDRHLRSAACLRALCEAEAQSIRSYGMRNPICVLPNGVDLPDLSETPKPQAHAFADDRKILLYLGRLHPKKNLANLIRAWGKTLNSQPSTLKSRVLVIAGWDQADYERDLKKLTSDSGLLESTRFLGPVFGQDKDAAYSVCHAFILPSLSEGLPITVLEAWASAKPVLMTRECNLPEGFAAGAALQIGTAPEEIAAGLKQLIEMSDDDRRAVGDRGRTLVATKFSWPRIGEQMRSVYEWILGGGTTPESVRL
jgi:glycosyltransferase involved in cell wall biosynthesis